MYVRLSSTSSTRPSEVGRGLANPAITGTLRCPQRRFGRNGSSIGNRVQGGVGAARVAAGFSGGAGERACLRGIDGAQTCVRVPEPRGEVAP